MKDNMLDEFINPLKHAFRTRKGFSILGKEFKDLKIFGKVINLDNEIPGIILDVFDNLGFITKDKRKPVIVSKKRTEYGWYLIINLPPGIWYQKVKDKQQVFSDACRAFVDIQWIYYKVHMDVRTIELEKVIPFFDWDPTPYLDTMALPWPIGYTHGGKLIVVDLAKFPHCLIGGATNFGKSSFELVLIFAMLFLQKKCPDRVRVALADRKGLDFYELSEFALLMEEDSEIYNFMKLLKKEHQRRKQIIRKYGCKKISQYKDQEGPIPYIVFVIDEFAEVEDKNIHAEINRAVRLYRATGIHLIVSTQRPSVTGGVMDGDTRGQFPARVAFKCADHVDSEIILGKGYGEAASLPGDVPGRAFFKFNVETQLIQSMFIDDKQEKKLIQELKGVKRWDVDLEQTTMLPK